MKIKGKEKRDKYSELARELKKLLNMTVIPIVTGILGTIPYGLVKGLEELELEERTKTIQITTFKIGQDTEKRLVVTQTPVKNSQEDYYY